jgi:two-component system chemotaxis sensor kinase CheA
MSDMMETFRQTYLEESFEGLDIMESGLLDLSPGTPDSEKINEIFRAAHSIKGGAGTFGFSEISGFTHVLETLLDEMRDMKRDVTEEATTVMLESVDVLRGILEALQERAAIDEVRMNEVQAKLEVILGKSFEKQSTGTEASDVGNELIGWKISFIPAANFIEAGNDPIKMIKSMGSLCDNKLTALVDTSGLPASKEINPTQSYLKWEITINSPVDKAELEEVFEWVDEDDAEIDFVEIKPEKVETASTIKDTTKTETNDLSVTSKYASKKQEPAKKQEGSIRVGLSKVDQMVNLVGELVITQSMLSQLSEDDEQISIVEREARLKEGILHLERHTRELQESVMNIRMLPVSFAFNRMPRIVHDISAKLEKKIELILEGENTELDKTMLESLTDPLVHIVRNSVDHGIEIPEKRLEAGKPEHGTVELAAFHEGGNILIRITDDGAGIDHNKIEQKAIEKGVIPEDHGLNKDEIVDLIFHPGFSTAEVVSDISGRGVGMDVVRRNIRGLGGSVEVRTEMGKGSVFTIRLPLTLAILDGQLCNIGDETYVFPLTSIVESIQIKEELVKGIGSETELYKLREEYIPIIRMNQVLGIQTGAKSLADGLLVIVDDNGAKTGLFVDDLMGQQQVVVKSLETNFIKIDSVSGATILGDGTVSFILDIKEAVESSTSKASNKKEK